MPFPKLANCRDKDADHEPNKPINKPITGPSLTAASDGFVFLQLFYYRLLGLFKALPLTRATQSIFQDSLRFFNFRSKISTPWFVKPGLRNQLVGSTCST